MVAYSFKPRFAAPILAGTKIGTIRPDRRRHARPGETLQLYTGMRTRQCRLIKTARCVAVDRIRLYFRPDFTAVVIGEPGNTAGDRTQVIEDLDGFARGDGFADWSDLTAFWRETHGQNQFDGIWIRWHPKAPSEAIDPDTEGA
jgi:hypothetical protein